jgi:hypothetical protein
LCCLVVAACAAGAPPILVAPVTPDPNGIAVDLADCALRLRVPPEWQAIPDAAPNHAWRGPARPTARAEIRLIAGERGALPLTDVLPSVARLHGAYRTALPSAARIAGREALTTTSLHAAKDRQIVVYGWDLNDRRLVLIASWTAPEDAAAVAAVLASVEPLASPR